MQVADIFDVIVSLVFPFLLFARITRVDAFEDAQTSA